MNIELLLCTSTPSLSGTQVNGQNGVQMSWDSTETDSVSFAGVESESRSGTVFHKIEYVIT